MRRAYIPLLAISLIAAACSSSAGDATPAELATQVAETLTAAPTLPPSRTAPPSATSAPSATLSPAPSTTPSTTPTSGPSSTPTGPPLPPDDPRAGLNLSAPDVSDDFSQQFNWFANFSDVTVEIIQENQQLRTTDLRPDTLITWSTSGETAGDLYAEVTGEIADCEGKDAAGFAVRIGNTNYDRGYALEVSCDGHYRLRKFINVASIPAVLIDWTPSEAINQGPNAGNRIGLLVESNSIYVFINNEQLGQANDPDLVFGNFGLYANAVSSDQITVIWDDFAQWNIVP